MSPRAELETIRERIEAATKGPWGVHVESAGDSVFLAIEPAGSFDWIADFDLNEEADAQFIAHARTDLPRLLDAVQAVLRVADVLDTIATERSLSARILGPSFKEVARNIREAINTALEGK